LLEKKEEPTKSHLLNFGVFFETWRGLLDPFISLERSSAAEERRLAAFGHAGNYTHLHSMRQ
jgi:hypothetical protein